VLRARYNFVQESVSQIEANVEVVIKDRLKAGYYTRYDNQRSEFIDNMALVRYSGSCGCWHVDLGLRDQVNPDKKSLTLNFTFVGLGDVRQNIGLPGSSS
jgi:lipopolysaccharide assembly outer membrane protein LptD (OstA)